MPLVIALVMFALAGVLGWYFIVGRTQKLKKQWTNQVVAKADELGAVSVPSSGFFSFPALRFDDLGSGPVEAMVFNAVPLEPHIASHYRFLNTNDWTTIIKADYPGVEGPAFSANQPPKMSFWKQPVVVGDAEFDKMFSLRGEDVDAVRSRWTSEARALLDKSGREFVVLSGGQTVTIFTDGVVTDSAAIRDMAQLAATLTTGSEASRAN